MIFRMSLLRPIERRFFQRHTRLKRRFGLRQQIGAMKSVTS